MNPNDIVIDDRSANTGTDRGKHLLNESVQACGFGRSAVIDKHGKVVVGNKVVAVAQAMAADVEVVQTDGQELVVVQRTDLDLEQDKTARQLAYYDNRVAEVDLSWSAEVVQADMTAGVDLSVAFFPPELDRVLADRFDVPAGVSEPIPDLPAETPTQTPAVTAGGNEPASPALNKADKPPVVRVSLTFYSAASRVQWHGLMRELTVRYPDAPSSTAAFITYLKDQGF